MKTIRRILWLNVVLFLVFVLSLMFVPIKSLQAKLQPDDLNNQESILVGRISHVEGELSRYISEEDRWVATGQDEPFYTDDLLRSDQDGRAEFILPNNTWMRINYDTQVQLHVLRDELTEIDVAFGLARFHNKGSYAVIKATTPFGYIMAPEETSFDLYVGPDSVEVIALKGTLDFFHNTAGIRFQVIAGKTAILADNRQVTPALGDVDPDWDSWNRDREYLWATRSRLGEESEIYLPPSLRYEAYALEEHGRWERVYYNGAYTYFWRPLYVSVGWAPFTVGRWTVCYGENVWVPCEPFGYVTHHYGNWVFVRGHWYWAPPVARVSVRVGLPLLDIGFAWYPGRVAWIHSGVYIGWVPLAPYEPYYCHRRWGPRTVVVKNVNINNVNINKYTYVKHSVVINKSKLYTVKNYRKVKRNVTHTTLAKHYRVTPVLDKRVVKNYKKRHQFRNAHEQQKPDRRVTHRSQQRHVVPKQRVDTKARTVRRKIPDARRSRRVETSDVRFSKTRDTSARPNHVDRRVPKKGFRETEPGKNPRVSTQARLDTRKDMQTVRTGKPVKSARPQLETGKKLQSIRRVKAVKQARPQKVQTEKQRHAVPKARRNLSSPPMKQQQDVRVKAPKQARSENQRDKGKSRVVLQSKPGSQTQSSNYSNHTRQRTRHSPQHEQVQPQKQHNQRGAEQKRHAKRWGF
jgi:hypothetical protein